MIYDKIAPFYDLFDADDPGALWHRAFVLARVKGIDAVMDVGAGTGRTAIALAERGLRVWAVEPSAGMRGVMLARLGDDTSLDDRLTIVPADAQTCDLGRTFSLVVFSHALYLLEGPAARAAALANLARHLAPATGFGRSPGHLRLKSTAVSWRILVRPFGSPRRPWPNAGWHWRTRDFGRWPSSPTTPERLWATPGTPADMLLRRAKPIVDGFAFR